jgi:hypothetical protein
VAQLEAAQSFELTLAVSGAPVLLDAESAGMDLSIGVVGAEGYVTRPNGVQAVVNVQIEDVQTQVNIIALGGEQFTKHILLTGNRWQALAFSENFNAQGLLSGDTSLTAALASISNLEYVGQTEVDGVQMYHLRGQVEAARVKNVTVGLVRAEEGLLAVDLYLRTRDQRLERLVIEEPVLPDQATTWTLGFYNYDGDHAKIVPPELGQ